ncbi:MAG: hypothetical protein PHV13_00015 [Candidatus ainarchaeum sp.]|nr:hypothetical protein [Candidatus ainarchaeum sp.]
MGNMGLHAGAEKQSGGIIRRAGRKLLLILKLKKPGPDSVTAQKRHTVVPDAPKEKKPDGGTGEGPWASSGVPPGTLDASDSAWTFEMNRRR